LAWLIVALSAVIARAGVARPDLDVIQLVVRRARREKELNPVSLGALFLQFLLSILTVPVAKLLPPSVLYQPELGPSPQSFVIVLALSVVLLTLVAWSWYGRLELLASAEQQREAEEHA
jgi:hypothetical protein